MIASTIGLGRLAVLGLGVAAGFLADGARAQVPPPPEPAEIQACLCLQQAYSALAVEMNAKTQALDAVNRQIADLDAQLARQRPTINVNNPDAVAQFKALLERRDATTRSLEPAHAEAAQAVDRYNARVNEYNARCANRLFNPALVAEIQAHLVCPPLR
jgi:hypothetical protein